MYPSDAYAHGGGAGVWRRLLGATAVAAAALSLIPAAAGADTSSSLTVVGTSDVSDSGLIQNLIQPEFENAYPQFTFKYVGSATGAAIQSAEGTGATSGPSVLIVHAASLENQFVAGGYSYQHAFGRAIFRNDFILAGPSGDPAGVGSGAPHDIARAFADVASAGVAGRASFISRGGTTTASGTTVEEHAIWQLVAGAGLTPAGVVLCTVSAADGGGATPINPAVQSSSGQACPDNGTVSSTDVPSWYVLNTGANQAANVQAANAKNAYVLTDRGTYDYLATDDLQGGASLVGNLALLTRDDSATAPGGADALINFFHAYIINPAAAGESVNLTAAEDFVDFLTSPTFQAQLKNYLAHTVDPGGAPFTADASPIITAHGLPKRVDAGRAITVSGAVTNAELGYPVLSKVRVNVDEIVGGVPVVVAHTATTPRGSYRVRFTPRTSGAYELSTPEISQVENTTLNPVFGDVLTPGATTPVTLNVVGLNAAHAVTFTSARTARGGVTVNGRLSPAPALSGASVELLALRTTGGPQRTVGHVSLSAGHARFRLRARLPAGAYILQLRYAQKGQTTVYSKLETVTVP